MLRIVDAGLPAQNRPQVVARMMDGTCPIREHAGDGGFVGRCDYPLHDHIYCPRHGRITDYPTLDDREVPVHQRNHMDPETPMLIKPYLLIAIAVAIGLTILIYTSIALFSTDERSTTYAADGAVATLAQIIPPAPYPTLGTAQARLRQSLEASCRKTNMKVTIDVGGIPLTVKTGKCMHVMGVPDNECWWEPAPIPRTRADRWECSGYMTWQTTGFSYLLNHPCFASVQADGFYRYPFRIIITAWRRGYVFIKKDGTVGLKVSPWGPCFPSKYA
jgi:hypothetical protein